MAGLHDQLEKLGTAGRIDAIQHAIATMLNPTDLLSSDPATLNGFDKDYFQELAKIVTNETYAGGDMAQFADPETRTAQQDHVARMLSVWVMYQRSAWVKAYSALRNAQPPEADTGSEEKKNADQSNVKIAAIMYFFISHPDLDPAADATGDAALTADHVADLHTIYRHANEYFSNTSGANMARFIASELSLSECKRKPVKVFHSPTDKIDSSIWRSMAHLANGQMEIDTARRGSGESVAIMFAVNFDELEQSGIKVTKKFTPYERRVCLACGAIFNVKGTEPFTLSEIYYAMGGSGKPGKPQLEKIDDAITKLSRTLIFISNAQEIDAGYNYPRFYYDGHVLLLERVTALINGKFSDAAIRQFREPPLITFAKQRGQFTTLDAKLLQTPGSKTDATIQLEDYLLERIAKAKNQREKLKARKDKDAATEIKLEKSTRERIMFDTLFSNAGATTSMQKARAREKIKPTVNHYKECSFIRGYTVTDTAITIELE